MLRACELMELLMQLKYSRPDRKLILKLKNFKAHLVIV